jgi:hypothetical protein
MNKTFKTIALVLGGLLAAFLAIQILPVWALKTNPPVLAEPKWDSPRTRALAQRACFDCHSNETNWPWYSNVAPVSWLVIVDTVRGRSHLNFSEWGSRRVELDRVGRMIQGGEMPPSNYLLTHPNAVLSDAEKQQLIDGLQKTVSAGGATGGAFLNGGEIENGNSGGIFSGGNGGSTPNSGQGGETGETGETGDGGG